MIARLSAFEAVLLSEIVNGRSLTAEDILSRFMTCLHILFDQFGPHSRIINA